MNPPPCIQTITGFFAVALDALRPDVQNLAVVVLQPVAMRKDELVDAGHGHSRDRADGSPCLRLLDAFPGLNGLGLFKTVRLGIGDAEEGGSLAIPESGGACRL